MCVVYDGNSCFKQKKRSGLFGGGDEHLRFLFGQLDMQSLCCSARFFFFPFLGSLFAIVPARTTYTYFENWSLHTSCSHLSHLKSARKGISLFFSCGCLWQDGQMYECAVTHSLANFMLEKKEKNLNFFFPLTFSGQRGGSELGNEE